MIVADAVAGDDGAGAISSASPMDEHRSGSDILKRPSPRRRAFPGRLGMSWYQHALLNIVVVVCVCVWVLKAAGLWTPLLRYHM